VDGSISLLDRRDVGEEVLNVLAAEAQVRRGLVERRMTHEILRGRFRWRQSQRRR
jgi:hypothetical protein